MGSIVTFGLAKLDLDWSKNFLGNDHSELFMPGDYTITPYYYTDGAVEHERALARPLRSVARRLDMLGYTLAECALHYEEAVEAVPHYYDPPSFSFEEYARIFRQVNVRAIELPEEGDYDLGEYVSRAIMSDPAFAAIDPRLSNLSSDDGTFFENLDPYVTLRLLAENPDNLDELVTWRVADVLDEGYVKEDDIHLGASEADICLVVTEGSTDSAILRASLPRVAPDVADFFDFVDMSENYPFTGTGNLIRFSQGLARIRVQNRILVVVDNDTAGRDALRRISALALPRRMRVVALPDLDECKAFPTLGPGGAAIENINGRAVSIEMFLDLSATASGAPTVRWTSYSDISDAYQGELQQKDNYTRRFLEAMRRGEAYDMTKLSLLWKHLIAACTSKSA
jgi:hypothetical protein